MILLAGVAAGALNAVGGGGSFVALSALVGSGMPPVTANATTTVALLPGNATSAWVYRRDLYAPGRPSTTALTVASVLGGYTGAHLVHRLPAPAIRALVLTTAVVMTVLFFVRAAR